MSTGANPHILVVDDDPLTRRMLEILLKSEGYATTTAADGLEAAAYAATDRYDLVITDYFMPERDGIELIRSLRRRVGGLRILLISAYPESEMRKAILNEEGVEFLAKPFRTADLLARVRAALIAAPQSPAAAGDS